jgi:hypothetical protein
MGSDALAVLGSDGTERSLILELADMNVPARKHRPAEALGTIGLTTRKNGE